MSRRRSGSTNAFKTYFNRAGTLRNSPKADDFGDAFKSRTVSTVTSATASTTNAFQLTQRREPPRPLKKRVGMQGSRCYPLIGSLPGRSPKERWPGRRGVSPRR
jgi:hypothetical protein